MFQTKKKNKGTKEKEKKNTHPLIFVNQCVEVRAVKMSGMECGREALRLKRLPTPKHNLGGLNPASAAFQDLSQVASF